MAFNPAHPGVKEMFANYGLTMMRANLVEKSLMLVLAGAYASEKGVVPANQVEAIIKEYDDETFGDIFKYLKKKVSLSDDLKKEIKRAILLRNDLAHKFFFNNLEALFQNRTSDMNEQLLKATRLFVSLSPKIDLLWADFLKKNNVPIEKVNAEVARLLNEAE